MNIFDKFVCKGDWLGAAPGIKSLIAVHKAEDFTNAVTMIKLMHQRADNVVQSGTEAAAGNDACPRFLGIEIKVFTRSGNFEQNLFFWRGFGINDDVEKYASLVADEKGLGGRETCFAKN